MNVFIDTNILIDLLSQREPHNVEALEIFKLMYDGKCQIFVSSISVLNTVYTLTNTYKLKKVLESVDQTTKELNFIPASKSAFQKAFTSGFQDFEDAVQYFSALEAGNIDYIITRDKKGFAQSAIPVLTPYQFIQKHLKK